MMKKTGLTTEEQEKMATTMDIFVDAFLDMMYNNWANLSEDEIIEDASAYAHTVMRKKEKEQEHKC